MKRILFIICISCLILGSCTQHISDEEKTSEISSILQFDTTTSDTQESENTISDNPDNTPSLSELFEIDGTVSNSDEQFERCIIYSSFEQIIDMFGKPQGFKKKQPDTLVWLSAEGTPYGIRFEITPQFEENDFKNALDQFYHSRAINYEPLVCEYVSGLEFKIDELPIIKKTHYSMESIEWSPNMNIFDINNHHCIPEQELHDFRCFSTDYIDKLSFTEIISYLGKPQGFRLNNPDTLVWFSAEGTPYGIRFEIIPQFEKNAFNNALDQFYHSRAINLQPVICDFVSEDIFKFDDLPIEKNKYPPKEDIDFQKLSTFFDTQVEHLVPEKILSNFNCYRMPYDEVVSYLGKPHSCVPDMTSSGSGFYFLWKTDVGNVYGIHIIGTISRIDQYTGKSFDLFKRSIYSGTSFSHKLKKFDDLTPLCDMWDMFLINFVDADYWMSLRSQQG